MDELVIIIICFLHEQHIDLSRKITRWKSGLRYSFSIQYMASGQIILWLMIGVVTFFSLFYNVVDNKTSLVFESCIFIVS